MSDDVPPAEPASPQPEPAPPPDAVLPPAGPAPPPAGPPAVPPSAGSTPPAASYPAPAATPPTLTDAAPPGWAGYAAPARTADSAIWGLVCAIGGWIVCPVVLAVVGLVLAGRATEQIDQSQGTLTGTGLVTATRVIAWVHLALVALALLFVLAVLVGLALGSG